MGQGSKRLGRGLLGARQRLLEVFVLLPRRWVMERSFGWMSRFRRLARDQKRLAEVLRTGSWRSWLDAPRPAVT